MNKIIPMSKYMSLCIYTGYHVPTMLENCLFEHLGKIDEETFGEHSTLFFAEYSPIEELGICGTARLLPFP